MDFNLKEASSDEAEPGLDPQPGRSATFWAMVGSGVGLAIVAVAASVYWMLRPVEPAPSAVVTTKAPPPVERAPARPEPEVPAPAAAAPRRRPAARETPAPAEPAPVLVDRGSLEVETDVPGASVFVDRVFHGPAPITIPDLTLGPHQVNVSAEGFDGVARSVSITPGANTLSVRFKEVTLDAAIPVVHKHRMGSCEGRLVATVQGLRYETSNKDDGFTVGFGQLGRFQVDYLKKTLRVERRGGRGYDFTDKQPTADALFVFHRDVEKAMKRLQGSPPS